MRGHTNMDEKKRRRISWIFSVIFHLAMFLIISFTGLLHYTSLEKSDIFEVTAVSGGGGGGGSSSGGGEISAPPTPSEPAATSESTAFTPEQIGSDAILQHSDTSKTKVTYEQLDVLRQEEKQEQEQTQETVENNVPTHLTTPKAIDLKEYRNSHGTGSSDNSDIAEQGNGTDSGEGTGSGQGNGSGTGTGDGNGNGNSTGNGEGNGIGEATDEVVSSPAVPPSVTRRVQPTYPSHEREAGITGTATIRFLIGKDGSVESVELVGSSGSSALDNAAVNAGYKWRFAPAKDEYGRPVRCYARQSMDFQLRN